MKHNPKINPRPGDQLAKVKWFGDKTRGFSGVVRRTVLAVEKRIPRGTTVVWTRKLPRNPCRCTLTEWRQWAKGASVC